MMGETREKLFSLPGEPFLSKADGKGWPYGLGLSIEPFPCHLDPLVSLSSKEHRGQNLFSGQEPEVQHRQGSMEEQEEPRSPGLDHGGMSLRWV